MVPFQIHTQAKALQKHMESIPCMSAYHTSRQIILGLLSIVEHLT